MERYFPQTPAVCGKLIDGGFYAGGHITEDGTKVIMVPVKNSYQSPLSITLLDTAVDIVNHEANDNKVYVVHFGEDDNFSYTDMFDFMEATLAPTTFYVEDLTLQAD